MPATRLTSLVSVFAAAPVSIAADGAMFAKAEIVAADAGDAPAIARCVDAAYRRYVARIGKSPGPMLDDYADVIARHRVFVVRDGIAVVGVLVLIETPAGILLDNVAVFPEHQGSGLGRRLIAHAEREARALGYAALELYTHECMHENLALYRALGYVETDRREERGYRRVYFRKPLGTTA